MDGNRIEYGSAGVLKLSTLKHSFHFLLVDGLSPPHLKQENLQKLAVAKADYVSEVFGRVRESVLQLQAFAEQAISSDPETMVVDAYIASHSGLQQLEETLEYSVW